MAPDRFVPEGERWGFLGGSFDPPHYGHLRMAEEVGEALGLSRIYFVPAGQNPLRSRPSTPYLHRFAMVERAIQGNPRFFLAPWEEDRSPSYTRDTLAFLTREYPGVRWVLLMGEDAFEGFPRWKDPLGILSSADLAIVRRSEGLRSLPELLKEVSRELGLEPREIEGAWQLRVQGKPLSSVFFPPTTLLPLSSTAIRSLLKNHRSCRYLVPPEVLAYIEKEGLYTSASPSAPEGSE